MSDDIKKKLEEVFEGEVLENLKKTVPQWNSVFQYMLEQMGKENRLSITFSDGSTLEYVSPEGQSHEERIEVLERQVDYWKLRCKQLLLLDCRDYNENDLRGIDLYESWVKWAEDAIKER